MEDQKQAPDEKVQGSQAEQEAKLQEQHAALTAQLLEKENQLKQQVSGAKSNELATLPTFTFEDGPSIQADGVKMIRGTSAVYLQQVIEEFAVETNEGTSTAHAGDYVAYDPVSGHVWPISVTYVTQHYSPWSVVHDFRFAVARERERQVKEHDFTAQHDDEHFASDWESLITEQNYRWKAEGCEPVDRDAYEAQLVKVAAVAQAAYEASRRKRGGV